MDDEKKKLFGIDGILSDCRCKRCEKLRAEGRFRGLEMELI